MPISYNTMSGAGVLALNIDGHDVTLGHTSPAPDGTTLFSWISTYDTPGQHYLQAKFTLNTPIDNTFLTEDDDSDIAPEISSALGTIVPFYSANMVQFFKNDSVFDSSGAYLDAQLVEQYADYTIDLYDPSTAPPTPLTTITGSTADGVIQEDWGVTNADGTPFTGNIIQAVFNITRDDPSTNTLTRLGSLETVGPHDGFEFAYFYTPPKAGLEWSFGNPNGNAGPLWQGMKSPVDILLAPQMVDLGGPNYYTSDFNYYHYNPGGNPHDGGSTWGYPGYLASQSDVDELLTKMADITKGDRQVKNVYINGHGNVNYMGTIDSSLFISTLDYINRSQTQQPGITRRLGNYDYDTASPNFLLVSNPFRFVFLDGCRTGVGHCWSDAFGIFPMITEWQLAPRDKLGPQAFVGWGGDTSTYTAGWWPSGPSGTPDTDKSIILAWTYSQTLADFYGDWMNGYTLYECIERASHADDYGQAPLSVPPKRSFYCYSSSPPPGYQNVPHFGVQLKFVAHIYVIGHSGLQRYNYKQEDDGQHPPPW